MIFDKNVIVLAVKGIQRFFLLFMVESKLLILILDDANA